MMIGLNEDLVAGSNGHNEARELIHKADIGDVHESRVKVSFNF